LKARCQAAVILIGHMASVWLAHKVAIRTFHVRGRAAVSQLPLLGLMVAYTIFGVWILSLPLASNHYRTV
jgi:hypothetical protein